jgi:hypothetical protein
MIRSIAVAVAMFAAVASANAQTGAPWPGGAGARDSSPSVSARAIGYAVGNVTYRGRITLERRGSTRDDAANAIERAVSEVIAIGGVEVRINRREASSFSTTAPAYVEQATIEVDARTRKAITDWAARIPAVPANSGPQAPIITERMGDADPAWDLAMRNGMSAAERDARIAADASGGELGRLVGVWAERLGVLDGAAQIQVTAEYLIGRRR